MSENQATQMIDENAVRQEIDQLNERLARKWNDTMHKVEAAYTGYAQHAQCSMLIMEHNLLGTELPPEVQQVKDSIEAFEKAMKEEEERARKVVEDALAEGEKKATEAKEEQSDG